MTCLNVILDTNAIVAYVMSDESDLLRSQFDRYKRYASIISRIEALGFPRITRDEEARIESFLMRCTMLDATREVQNVAINLRRHTSLKLPDSIIAATAICLGVTLISNDDGLLKTAWPGLRVQSFLWAPPIL